MNQEEYIDKLKTVLDSAQTVLVITHVGPDGDAIGSITAVGQVLTQWGKKPILLCDDDSPTEFSYLEMSDRITRKPPGGQSYDAVIAVDCGDEERMGQAFADLKPVNVPVINIDHHISNTNFGDINIVDDEATATAEILTQLLPAMGAELTTPLAESLLTGLVTDTLCFRVNSVTGTTLRLAGILMEAGADLPRITAEALVLKPVSTMEMWRVGLNKAQVDEGIAWTAISQAEQKKVGKDAASEGLANFLADMYEVKMSAVLKEKEDNKVSVSFRSRPPHNVSAIAVKLGGGGHKLAAGCMVEGTLNEAVEQVLSTAKAELSRQAAVREATDGSL